MFGSQSSGESGAGNDDDDDEAITPRPRHHDPGEPLLIAHTAGVLLPS